MAKSALFQTSQQTNVIIGTEATFGTKAATGATRIHMPVTSYSFSEVDKIAPSDCILVIAIS